MKGQWFVSNTDSSFFTADTLIFFKQTNKEKWDGLKDKRQYLEPVQEYVDASNYVNLEFKKWGKADLWQTWAPMNAFWTIPIKWNFKNDIITLKSEKFIWKFKVISVGQVKFEHLIANHSERKYETLSTPSITVKRIK